MTSRPVRRSASTRIWPLRALGAATARRWLPGRRGQPMQRAALRHPARRPAGRLSRSMRTLPRRRGRQSSLTADNDQQPITISNADGANMSFAQVDHIVASAGATHPLRSWLDALLPGGRLLFPMTATPALLARVDRAACRRCVSRSAWVASLSARRWMTRRPPAKLAECVRTTGLNALGAIGSSPGSV